MSEEPLTKKEIEEMSDKQKIDHDICPQCGGQLIHIGGCTECRNKCGFTLCG